MRSENDIRLPKAEKAKTSLEIPIRLHEALMEFAEHLNDEGERTTRTELVHAAALLVLTMDTEDARKALGTYRRTMVSDLPTYGSNLANIRKLGRPK